MRSEYYTRRAEKITEQRRLNNNQLKQTKLKVPNVCMLKFIKQAARAFNQKQVENQSVKKIFEKLGQSPWYQGEGDSLTEHLNQLKDFAHFKREVLDNDDGNVHADLDGISSVVPE